MTESKAAKAARLKKKQDAQGTLDIAGDNYVGDIDEVEAPKYVAPVGPDGKTIVWPPKARYAFFIEGEYLTRDRKMKSYKMRLFDDKFIAYESSIANFRRNKINPILLEADTNCLRESRVTKCKVVARYDDLPKDSLFALTMEEMQDVVVEEGLPITVELYDGESDLRQAIIQCRSNVEHFLKHQTALSSRIKNKVALNKLNPRGFTSVEIGK